MTDQPRKKTPAESLWGIANEITETVERGAPPNEMQAATYAIALAVLAADVEKLAAENDAKDQRLRAVLALCSRAEREGVTSSDTFTVASVRQAVEGPK